MHFQVCERLTVSASFRFKQCLFVFTSVQTVRMKCYLKYKSGLKHGHETALFKHVNILYFCQFIYWLGWMISQKVKENFRTFQYLWSGTAAAIYQDAGMLRLSWVQCFTDVPQRMKRVFILPSVYALWRMADQLIMETCSSGILSKGEVSHKHLVLVI